MATVGTVLVFGTGVAAAALADPLQTPTEPTTTATTTDSTTTETTTPGTVTTTTETATTTATPTTTSTAVEPAPRQTATTPAHAIPRRAVRDSGSEGARPAHAPRKKRHRRISRPLATTPPLGPGTYVFPIVGTAGYGDSYGGFRGDVRGKWHHGDDIFAPLGAPVVAVADGTVNRVGWHRIGGWRLWVRDTSADQFYYAHLSGYAPGIFHSRHVRAGQVIGFVGNTGDAFGGAAHLHFEVHPRQLLRLRYDGAVDPTTYLEGWARLQTVDAPFPVHPRLPRQPGFRREARGVFRELLAARHVLAQSAVDGPEIDRPDAPDSTPPKQLLALREEPATPAPSADPAALTFPLLVALLSVAAFTALPVLGGIVLTRRWRRRLERS